VVTVAPGIAVHIRRGAMTLPTLAEIDRATITGLTRGSSPTALVSVIEQGAPIPDAAVRAEQKRVLGKLFERADLRCGVVIEGDDVQTSLARSVARTLLVGNPRVRIGASIDEIAEFIGGYTELDRSEVVRAIADARASFSSR
jgi:hypothetical protein